MKRLGLALVVVLAAIGGTARADTFAIGPQTPPGLPSAETPNASEGLTLPAGWTTPPASPQQLSYEELLGLWQRAGAAYGIPWPVLAAINKVESNFGRNMGPSSAGAIGWMQFMPSTWLRWGTDGNGDGVADPWNPVDGVFSAARYLAAAGGRSDLARAVFAYNHAQWYVDEVLGLAQVFERSDGSLAFTLDRAQVDLSGARRVVVAKNRALVAALRRAKAIERVERRFEARERRARLLSDQLALHKRVVQLDVRRQAALAEADRLRAELDDAEQALQTARETAAAAAVGPAAGKLLAAPTAASNYVFPVGGGPGLVSVGPNHHDYPAADIAAPAGSPVYALADAIVVNAWRYPDPRCGIGLTMRTGDGLEWTYCHLGYLAPEMTAGAFLSAGAPVGLVGSTGHATGPHLHLQLQPATAYPQDMAWFRAFAGSAFTWQGESPARALTGTAGHPVFAIESSPQTPASGVIAFTR